jgi:hypothetical protein
MNGVVSRVKSTASRAWPVDHGLKPLDGGGAWPQLQEAGASGEKVTLPENQDGAAGVKMASLES